MRSSAHPTEVVIFGRTYQLRGERRPEELRRLARLVDGRMREIAPNPTQSDGMKVAVLAAINFADEIEKYRQVAEEKERQIDGVSSRLTALLADCLEVEEGAATRYEAGS
ncbi:MAG: cell division protein ZapA [Acidobacteria bacterium]|nr:MAG: cell division protein ZapA [Acidobacteriota bacterium]